MIMPGERSTGKFLDRLAIGSFILYLGVVILLQDLYTLDFWAIASLGAGAMLLILNLARALLHVGISSFSLVLGAALLILGWTRLQELDYNWFAIVLIVVGIWVLGKAGAERI